MNLKPSQLKRPVENAVYRASEGRLVIDGIARRRDGNIVAVIGTNYYLSKFPTREEIDFYGEAAKNLLRSKGYDAYYEPQSFTGDYGRIVIEGKLS